MPSSYFAQNTKLTNGYFVPLGSCVGKVSSYVAGTGAGGSFLPGTFAIATWSQMGGAAGAALSSISSIGQGGLLKDMGKTVVSSNRTFRKVQLVVPGGSSSTGVGGLDTNVNPYLTGYIELATGNTTLSAATSNVAPVAYLPGLM